ncbi:hypothetical protein GOP47_0010035 [Adiantum capillus-veneris]|uniref:Uncharacterized protein n=1 Tax=Adiantum capillus-veneris TaxID=13818 RepID=A0A9D4UU03_ADICA|nr:hypothetical protein GOP47_0010035 [Adiantum capillus-veneris]
MAFCSTPGYRSIEDFLAEGLSYKDACDAYYSQSSSHESQSTFGFRWFRDVVHSPDLERAYRAQAEWLSS